jgi:hypothetical protein
MLTLASDFWPLFWTIVGAGALLTVLLTTATALVRRPLATVTAGSFGTSHDDEVRAAA